MSNFEQLLQQARANRERVQHQAIVAAHEQEQQTARRRSLVPQIAKVLRHDAELTATTLRELGIAPQYQGYWSIVSGGKTIKWDGPYDSTRSKTYSAVIRLHPEGHLAIGGSNFFYQGTELVRPYPPLVANNHYLLNDETLVPVNEGIDETLTDMDAQPIVKAWRERLLTFIPDSGADINAAELHGYYADHLLSLLDIS